MADLLLPAAARARLGATGRLIARPHSAVVHVAAAADRQLTPGGRLRRAAVPVCGQPGLAWPLTTVTGRRLCTRCAATVTRTTPSTGALLREHLLEDELRDTITTARDDQTLAAAVTLLCQARPGVLSRLSPLVSRQRAHLGRVPAPLMTLHHRHTIPTPRPARAVA